MCRMGKLYQNRRATAGEPEPQEEKMMMTVPRPRSRPRTPLDAGQFGPRSALSASASRRRHDLARWFETQFSSTQCRTLTGCDFATTDGVHAYIEHDGTSECARIARLVAQRVTEMIAAVPADVPADGSASRDTASGT